MASVEEIDKDKITKVVGKLWKIVDKKKIGAITKKQAKNAVVKALTVLGKEDLFKEKLFEFAFNKVDADGDGALNEEEFVNLVDHFVNHGSD